MARLVKGVYVRIIDADGQRKTSYTRYEVRGHSQNIYRVSVDGGNLWTCTCRSHGYNQGKCYHILMTRMEIDRVKLLKEFCAPSRIYPEVVGNVDFDTYFNMDRFVVEPAYTSPREYLTVGCRVYLGLTRKRAWEVGEWARLAGTVLEGSWEGVKGEKRFRAFDCLMHRGDDLLGSPWAFRRDTLEKVLSEWKPDQIELSECGFDDKTKAAIVKNHKHVILKDMGSTLVPVSDTEEFVGNRIRRFSVDRTPRVWMVKGR